MPNALPEIVKETDPEAGRLKTDVVNTIGGANEKEFDKDAAVCNIDRTITGDLATDAHVLMLTRESDVHEVASETVPDIRTLKTDENVLVPRPAPEIERGTDPLPGTMPGRTILTPGIAIAKFDTNTCDGLEVNDATMPILF